MALSSILSSELYMFLCTFVFISHLTVIPQLIIHKLCLAEYNATVCDHFDDISYKAIRDDVFGSAAMWNLGILLSQLVPSLVTVLFWGPMADRIGRSTIMILPPIIGAVQCCVYFLCSVSDSHVAYLYAGSWISSLYGELQGVILLSYGYTASSTNHDDRTLRMTVLEACLYAGAVPAVLATGYFIQHLGFAPVFLMTFSVHAVNIFYVVFLLPRQPGHGTQRESPGDDELTDAKPEDDGLLPVSLGDTKVCSTFSHLVDVVWRRNADRVVLLPLLVSFGLMLMVVTGELDLMVLYVKNAPFLLSPSQTSYYQIELYLIRTVGMVVFSQLSVRLFNATDYTLAIVGVLSQLCVLILTGLSSNRTMLFLVAICGFGFAQPFPVMRSLMSKLVHDDNQCAAVAVFEFVDVVAAILAALSVSSIYKQTVEYYPGTAYFLLSLMSFMALLILLYLMKTESKRLKGSQETEEETAALLDDPSDL